MPPPFSFPGIIYRRTWNWQNRFSLRGFISFLKDQKNGSLGQCECSWGYFCSHIIACELDVVFACSLLVVCQLYLLIYICICYKFCFYAGLGSWKRDFNPSATFTWINKGFKYYTYFPLRKVKHSDNVRIANTHLIRQITVNPFKWWCFSLLHFFFLCCLLPSLTHHPSKWK